MAGMSEARKETGWPVVVGLVATGLLILLPTLYVGGYFTLARGRHEVIGSCGQVVIIIRSFREKWHANLFRPAAIVEGLIVGKEVYADWVPDRSH